MTTYKDVIETITRTRLGLRELSKQGRPWEQLAIAFDDNLKEIDQFLEAGMKDYQELKQVLAIERAINRELNKQIGQLTCHKTF